MLLMVEKGIRGGIWHVFHPYAKGYNKYMKNHNENTESSYLGYWNENKHWKKLQKLPVNSFK